MVLCMKNYIDGEWISSRSKKYLEVKNPAFDEVIALCPLSTEDEVERAVRSAKDAFWEWRNTPPPDRAEYLFKLKDLIERHRNELAETIVNENGKTFDEAMGELTRGIQYVEHACAIAELLKGSFSEDVGRNVDEYYIREPLGVFVIIPPFNFPAMIPLYFTWAVAAGNTVVIKPSEVCPLTTSKIIELCHKIGFPKGVVNMILGGAEVGRALVSHQDVAGVTFVGSSKVAEEIYKLATSKGKRAQCQGGANNHALIMEDANLDGIMQNLVNSCFGNAGQRCFAISNVLVVDEIYDEFIEKFLERVKKIKLGYGMDKDVTMGPVVSKQSLERLLREIELAIDEGAKLLLDGRKVNVEKYPNGYFLGPTIFEAEPGMRVFDEEIFGPIRCVKKVKDFEEGISIINANRYGHTAVIYTESGRYARDFTRLVNTGQVGINVGTPAPIAFYPVGGRKISFFGSTRGRANDAIDFYTDKKVVVSRWLGKK